MSQQEDLTALQRRLDELVQRVGELEHTVERLRGAAHNGGSTDRAARARALDRTELVTIPDTPYNHALWTDSDDEGLGLRDRHAP
ncbi:hypothetical protein ACFVIM_21755 [Streptomyces sp. NPDC057638]|uniref:hypothetical protein n=1 Tax=Streptomyces sp. NPDC057638 TaxID=3346190 RepID=UPI0036A7D086